MKRRYDKYVTGSGHKIFKHGARSREIYSIPRFESSSGGGTGLEDSEDSEDHKHGLACRVAKSYVATEKFLNKYQMQIALALLGALLTYLAVEFGIYLSKNTTTEHWIIAGWVTGFGAGVGLFIWAFVKICVYIEKSIPKIGKWAHKKARDC